MMTRLFMLTLGLCLACSDPNSSPKSDAAVDVDAVDAAQADAAQADADPGVQDASADAGPCNALVLPATSAVFTMVASDWPTAAGGTLADGDYVLTAATWYTGANGSTGSTGVVYRELSRVAGSTLQTVLQTDTDPPNRFNETLSISGTSLTVTPVCPAGGTTQVLQYTATATELDLFILDKGSKTVFQFAKQ